MRRDRLVCPRLVRSRQLAMKRALPHSRMKPSLALQTISVEPVENGGDSRQSRAAVIDVARRKPVGSVGKLSAPAGTFGGNCSGRGIPLFIMGKNVNNTGARP